MPPANTQNPNFEKALIRGIFYLAIAFRFGICYDEIGFFSGGRKWEEPAGGANI